MDAPEYFVHPADLAMPGGLGCRPFAFVDLRQAPPAFRPADIAVLPPCPIIAAGPEDHPLAPIFDAVVAPPFTCRQIAEAILAQPMAAAVLAQLLRVIPQLSDEDALTAESLAYATLQGSDPHRRWQKSRVHKAAGPKGQVNLARRGDRLILTLDRPAAGNAIDRAMRDGLHEGLALANADPEIVHVVLRGNGKAFSLGAELGEFGTTTDPATAHSIRMATLPARAAIGCKDRLEAIIDGACVGAGLELAAFARRITATRRSWFQLPELAMGIIPGAGGCVSLSRRFGRQRTALLVLSGRRLSALRALEWGLVDEIVDDPA